MQRKVRELLPAMALFLFPLCANTQPQVDVVSYASGFNSPVDIANCGDTRLFIVEKSGYIQILHDDMSVSQFLDIDALVKSSGSEQGLLGLAFHPDYAMNGYFYVDYTDNSNNTVIERFTRSAIDPDVADAGSGFILMTITQPYTNHNGGNLEFGPDGYLYIGTGDGGSGGDPGNRAQDITSQKLGKMLRLDVDGGTPYGIPADNPFVGITGDDEIWQYGLRNPWRFSFDRLTGDLWIGDVGQSAWEEVDFQPAASAGGENWGWRCYEGNHTYNTAGCAGMGTYDFPVMEYDHSFDEGGYAITGGYVYRGTQYPGMFGYYITCDYATGNFWTIVSDGMGGWNTDFLGSIQTDISSFGEGSDGEIYACDLATGNIYHVIDACGNFHVTWAVNNADIGWNNGSIDLSVVDGTAPFTYLWSTGATTQDVSGLATGTFTVTVTDNAGCITMAEIFVDEECGPVPSIDLTGATSSTADLSWVNEGAPFYKYRYRQVAGGPWTQSATGTNSVHLTGLLPSTSYTFQMGFQCPGGSRYIKSTVFSTTARYGFEADQKVPALVPNPGSGIFHLTDMVSPLDILVYDITGTLLFSEQGYASETIDLSILPAGMYIVHMQENGVELGMQKLIIQR